MSINLVLLVEFLQRARAARRLNAVSVSAGRGAPSPSAATLTYVLQPKGRGWYADCMCTCTIPMLGNSGHGYFAKGSTTSRWPSGPDKAQATASAMKQTNP